MSAEDTKPCRDCDRILKCGPGWPITPDCCSEYGHWEAAYAAGREELARDIWEWWSAEVDCFNDEIVAHFEEWLREKGVM